MPSYSINEPEKTLVGSVSSMDEEYKMAYALGTDEQIELLNQVLSEEAEDIYPGHLDDYYCAITDLNCDSNLELIISACQGTGHYSYLLVYEINSELGTAVKIEPFSLTSGSLHEHVPDLLLIDEMQGIFDEDEQTFKYYVSDIERDGPIIDREELFELSFGKDYSLNSVATWRRNEENGEWSNASLSYYSGDGKEISEEEYGEILDNLEAEYNIEYGIEWIRIDHLKQNTEERKNQLVELYESQRFGFNQISRAESVTAGKRVSETIEAVEDDSEFKEIVDKVVQVKEGEKLEKAEWIEEGILFRVAVERTEAIPHEYSHLRDYIFVKKDGVKWFEVVYPSKLDFDDPDRYVNSGCNFSVRYEDVTFDGNADVLISLGDAGPNRVFCAYVYEDGEFCYKKSFENIPFSHVDYEEKTIIGFITDGYSYQYEAEYAYEDGEFVLKSETHYKWDDALGKYVIKE